MVRNKVSGFSKTKVKDSKAYGTMEIGKARASWSLKICFPLKENGKTT